MKDLMDTFQEPATVRAHIASPTPEHPPIIAPAPAYQFVRLGHLATPRQPPPAASPVASLPSRKGKRKGPVEAEVPKETGPSLSARSAVLILQTAEAKGSWQFT
eukprot:Seg5341.3 transcript_id=Seg5341.3/GoldUCD/mRNA.D3Y31 product="hypothetical protein" protein_id=Seg5341.3/GoldUCD/D3Y31